MPTFALAQLINGNKIGFTYNPEEAMESVGPEELKDLVPVVILRHFELSSLRSGITINILREELELIAPRGL